MHTDTIEKSNLDETTIQPWSGAKKLSFRFVFSFFGLLIFPFPLHYIPYSYKAVFKYYGQAIEWLSLQVGKYMLGIQNLKNKPNGSGDTTYDWVQMLTLLMVGMAIALIWSLLDRKRPAYRALYRWLLMIVSLYLMYYMFAYGFAKVFYLQFREPNLERLFQTYGNSSPMRLMWTFMGASHTYTVFAGASEVLAGLLLIFRKTRTFGGLVTVGVMFNVFMMNMSYDIPVKIFSFQLMAMGLWVAYADYPRLIAVLVTQKDSLPSSGHQPLFTRLRYQRILVVVQLVLIGYISYLMISARLKGQKTYGVDRPKPALYGIYETEKFVKNGQTMPPLLTDTTRWRRLLIDYPKRISVMRMDDRFIRYKAKTDTVKKQMILNTYKDTVNKYTLTYEQLGKDLKLKGVLQKDTVEIHLKHYPKENFLLLNRGFHWINEWPYNAYKITPNQRDKKSKKGSKK
jgi:uncharacterized membrane protein YphA (DoxX/SURF4 family)